MLTCSPSGCVSGREYLAESLDGVDRVLPTDDEGPATTLMNSLWPIKAYSLSYSV